MSERFGTTMGEIYGDGKWSLSNLEPVLHERKHIVLYYLELKTKPENEKLLNPRKGEQKWDLNHVRLPCAEQNKSSVR